MAPSEPFPWVQLRYVAKTGTGHTPSRTRPELWIEAERSIPWVTLADVHQLRKGTLDVLHETAESISPAGVAASSAVVHPAGTVLLSRTASVGFSALMGTEMAVSQDFMTWTPGPKLSGRFLLHVLRGRRSELLGLMHGSTHKTIYMPDLLAIKSPLPTIDVQHRIADFLDRECDRIGRAVDAIDGLSSKVWDELRSNVELATAPTGDHPGIPIRHVATVFTGGTPEASEQVEGSGVPWYTPQSFGRRVIGPPVRCYREGSERLRQAHGPAVGVVIIGATAGRVAYLPDGGSANQQIAVVVPRSESDAELLGWSLWARHAEIACLAVKTTLPIISLGALRGVRVAWPETHERDPLLAVWRRREAVAESIGSTSAKLTARLIQYRDALIREAITGQLDPSRLSDSELDESVRAAIEGERPEVLSA